jgi:hypothetical protein
MMAGVRRFEQMLVAARMAAGRLRLQEVMAGGPTRERFADAQQAGAVPAHSVHEIALRVLSGERFLQWLPGQQQLLLLLLLLLLFGRLGLLLSVRRFSLQIPAATSQEIWLCILFRQ